MVTVGKRVAVKVDCRCNDSFLWPAWNKLCGKILNTFINFQASWCRLVPPVSLHFLAERCAITLVLQNTQLREINIRREKDQTLHLKKKRLDILKWNFKRPKSRGCRVQARSELQQYWKCFWIIALAIRRLVIQSCHHMVTLAQHKD